MNSHDLKKLLIFNGEIPTKSKSTKEKKTINLSKLDEIEKDIFKSEFSYFTAHQESVRSSVVES